MCENQKAVNFVKCIQELAIAMKLNVFVVTDGVMGVINTDNKEIETLLNEYVKNKNISKKVLTRCQKGAKM